MSETAITVLLIEDSPGDANLICQLLKEAGRVSYEVRRVGCLAEGLARLTERNIDVTLTDLNLPDSRGLETLKKLRDQVPQMPIVIMTNMDNEQLVLKAMRQGAQDYLIKGQLTVEVVDRAIRYALERKQTELARERLLRQNELILNTVGEGILGLDARGEVIFVNPAGAVMLGYDVEEMVGQPYHSLVHHSKQDGTPYPQEECPIYDTLRTGVCNRGENEAFWRANGTCFPIEYTSTPIVKDGTITGAVVTFQDITERKLAEERYRAVQESLRRERDLLSRVMETGAVGITVANRQGEIIFANTTATRILNLSKDEITQRTYDAPAWRITDHYGQPFPEEELPFRRVMDTGQAVLDVRHAIESSDGNSLFLSIDAAPLLDDAEQVERVVFTIEDVTAQVRAKEELEEHRLHLEELVQRRTDELLELNKKLKIEIQEHLKAEAALRDAEELSSSILNSLTAYIVVADAAGEVIASNNAWREFDRDSDGSLLAYAVAGQNYFAACQRAAERDEQAARALAGMQAVLDGKKEAFELEYSFAHGDQERYFLMRVTPFAGSMKRGIVISYTDITERRRAQQAEAAARAAAARAEQQAREFSHLERMGVPRAGITSRLYGTISLREAQPNMFEELVQEYHKTLDLALEQRAYKVEHNISSRLREMGERLGYLNARPRDVVDIHTVALRSAVGKVNWTRSEAYAEEGRLLVLELMGYLVSFYRSYSLDFRGDLSANYRNLSKNGMISGEEE